MTFDQRKHNAEQDRIERLSKTTLTTLSPQDQVNFLILELNSVDEERNPRPFMTIHTTTSSIFDVQQKIEDDVFSGIPLSLGVCIRTPREEPHDPFLILVFGYESTMAELDGQDVRGDRIVMMEEAEFGRSSGVRPNFLEGDSFTPCLTDFSKERVQLTIPFGSVFKKLDAHVYGRCFKEFMADWSFNTDLGSLRAEFLREFELEYAGRDV